MHRLTASNGVEIFTDRVGQPFFGAMNKRRNGRGNGKVSYGSIDPGAKQALSTLKTWMEKGYITKDAGLVDENGGYEQFTKGQAGAIVGRNWLPDWPFGDLLNNVPGAKYKAYAIPCRS